MNQQTMRTVGDGEGTIQYTLERKAVKNINLRIRRDGSVYVSASCRVPLQRIDGFVQSKLDFVREAQAKAAQRRQRAPAPRQYVTGEIYRVMGREFSLQVGQGSPEGVFQRGESLVMQLKNPQDAAKRQRLFSRWWDEACKQEFGSIMAEIQPAFARWGVEMPSLRLRDMTSRWGTCTPAKKQITLNKRLLSAPLPCIQYVVLHEFCHFIHPDHSARFYSLLASFMPDWKARKQLLEQTADF